MLVLIRIVIADSDHKIRVDNKLAASKHEKEDVSVIDICGYFYL